MSLPPSLLLVVTSMPVSFPLYMSLFLPKFIKTFYPKCGTTNHKNKILIPIRKLIEPVKAILYHSFHARYKHQNNRYKNYNGNYFVFPRAFCALSHNQFPLAIMGSSGLHYFSFCFCLSLSKSCFRFLLGYLALNK